MVDMDMRFSNEEIELLCGAKGNVLEAIGYVPVTSGLAFGRVRLYLSGGAFDIVSRMHDIDYSGNGEVDDDDAFLSIEQGLGSVAALSELSGEEMRVECGKVVKRVLVAQDSVDSYEDGKLTFKTAYPQAVLFDFGDQMMSIDKQACNWMMLTVKFGENVDELVYDSGKGWEVNSDGSPEIRNEFKREMLEL
ncbi:MULTISPECIES: hypothetical protein [unclassified Collinsella]|uniref:hypothetical protein n=1 Tax=unclassified Collinsella TaxID=2637548 RepID=UPI0011CB037B|nr:MULTISPECIES: hypothetical protein [unclassified Collinsella]TXF38991.1 hypothetical protein E4J93_00620 [Collinsella sp. BA40]